MTSIVRTLADCWDLGYDDAKSRRQPCNPFPQGSQRSDHYVRGYLAGMLARGFTAQSLSA